MRAIGRLVVQETPQAKRYFISGFVQGVGYRFFVERVANRLDIAGYVRNLRDGRVEAYAIGAGAQLAAFREELERGPHGSSVMSVDEKDAPIDSHYQNGFSIEHTF